MNLTLHLQRKHYYMWPVTWKHLRYFLSSYTTLWYSNVALGHISTWVNVIFRWHGYTAVMWRVLHVLLCTATHCGYSALHTVAVQHVLCSYGHFTFCSIIIYSFIIALLGNVSILLFQFSGFLSPNLWFLMAVCCLFWSFCV